MKRNQIGLGPTRSGKSLITSGMAEKVLSLGGKRKSILAAALAATLSIGTVAVPPPAQATGIPVIDISGLIQAITQYTNELKQYAEMIEHTVLNQKQLVEAINLYEQTMTSYYQVLRQMEGLKQKLSPEQWNAVMERYGRIYDLMPTRLGDARNAALAAANQEVGKLYFRGEGEDAIHNKIDSSYEGESAIRAKEQYDGIYARSLTAASQQAQANAFQADLIDRADALTQLEDQRMSLTDSDELATTQFIAEQNSKTLETLQQLVAVSNAQFQNANQFEHSLNANMLRAQEAEVERARRNSSSSFTVDNSPVVKF